MVRKALWREPREGSADGVFEKSCDCRSAKDKIGRRWTVPLVCGFGMCCHHARLLTVLRKTRTGYQGEKRSVYLDKSETGLRG